MREKADARADSGKNLALAPGCSHVRILAAVDTEDGAGRVPSLSPARWRPWRAQRREELRCFLSVALGNKEKRMDGGSGRSKRG
jgi:hypothetical protein